ncbi:uncharacterized protein LOC111921087 [Lactuca sativa]|uniref:uncharacterized protein LOC111921087 n=1 Tax=Lactuca sativa TaxID=4236 RepID=UPI000CD9E281|nr:uncharacterized protein LOC111921087 [Lactuca sativa]
MELTEDTNGNTSLSEKGSEVNSTEYAKKTTKSETHEDDVSFSDLEDEDNDLSSRSSGIRQRESSTVSLASEASDWVHLNERKANQSRHYSKSEESSDWQAVGDVSDLRKNLNIINSTVEQTRGSAKLKRVMQTILSLGNALNQGTARGSAIRFRLDSLLKLTNTHARNNRMTFMHYLCKVLADKLPEVLDFSKDLQSLEPAAKMQLKYLAEEMQAITKGLEKEKHGINSLELPLIQHTQLPDLDKLVSLLNGNPCSGERGLKGRNLIEYNVKNVDEILKLLLQGAANRKEA